MKNAFALIALGALFAGSVACTSAPKQEDQAPAQEAAVQSEPQAPIADEQPAPQQTPAPSQDMSLGASSSGRGH